MKNKLIVGLFILSGTFTSCMKKGCTDTTAANFEQKAKKDDGSCTYPDATLTISSPTTNEMLANGDTLNIAAIGSYYKAMAGWSLYLINKTTGDTALTTSDVTIDTDYTIQSSWVNNVADTSDMKLEINLLLNATGNTKSTSVTFKAL